MHRQWQIELSSCEVQGASCTDASRTSRDEGFPRDADGIIMRDHRGSPTLLKRGIPIVFASHLHKDIRGGHRILTDDRAIGRTGATHLLERGFRRFAFVGYDGLYWSQQREESFLQTVISVGHECTAFRQARDLRLRTWRKEQKALADWLGALPRPVGLMACNDDRARQAVDACAMAGLSIPEEVAIVGVDNDEFVCNLSNPPISSVALGIEDAGYRAAALLDQLMNARREEKEREARTWTSTDLHGLSRTPQSAPARARPCASAPSSTQIPVSPITVVTRRSSDISAIEDPFVAEAVRFIRANSRRPIQIADILQKVAISRRNLFNRFTRTLGYTVHQYIKKTRVAEIEQLLLGTSYSIDQIAEMLGFPSSEHIAPYFHSVKRVNPHTFRAQCRPR